MKPVAHDDPMELVGMSLPAADPQAMARCLIEEYLLLGWDEQRIAQLFARPAFRATHALQCTLGEERVRALIGEVFGQWVAKDA
ncbi:MAG: hypothetical protein HS128_07280 [Ideonella sp.]|nr:hypothetical protein [Ideonella sp.]MCC7459556.1 hypothetical protein [Nitrospira sp.]